MVPGCIRHCHFPDTPELLRNSFKLVSVRNMTSTLVRRWISRITFCVCLYINSLQFKPTSKFYFLSILTKNTLLEKRGNRNAKKPLVKECTHKGKNAMTRYKEIIHHLRSTKQRTQRAKLKWFSMRFSLFLTIWPIVQPFSHYIWVCKLYWFPHGGKKERKRCSFHESHVCLDCPQKRSASGSNPGERIYNHSVKRQHPLLERNQESVTRS